MHAHVTRMTRSSRPTSSFSRRITIHTVAIGTVGIDSDVKPLVLTLP
jgi:hypothetical protein